MWSPDGRYVAFSRIVKGEHRIYTVSAIGGAERKLFSGPAAHPPLDWSPDGRSIAFTRKALDKEAYSLYSISVESGTPQLRNHNGSRIRSASPDGKQLHSFGEQ
jgi:Tol biopolymer transport system component